MMKKILCLCLLSLSFTGCPNDYSDNVVIVNKAEVLEVNQDRILVKPYDTIDSDVFYFLISDMTEIDDNIQVGDYISAILDNKFMMSYPGQVNAYRITKIK